MVYSAIETTCFDLYWPASCFYNIKEESIKAVKTVRGCWLRDPYINPLTTLFLVQKLFVNREKFIHRGKIFTSAVWRWGYSSWGCINFEVRSGYCISPLSLWGTSFIGDLGGFLWGWREPSVWDNW